VAPVRLLVGELARPGYLEPLLRTAVRLLLRHGGLLLLYTSLCNVLVRVVQVWCSWT